ncbi:MAG: hypothetical protein FRX48_05534 [Lasallia pustulata]|uniref:Uncharacterized protein n=1 Tax=Lasallia pustulata TaxID=136370 RepID=A0A5M8PKZ6_9LECA|nr:MAG: hypothetical protein FRX48_05534 [Lasallia pustulata]
MAKGGIQYDAGAIEDDRPIAVRRKRRSSTGLQQPAQHTRSSTPAASAQSSAVRLENTSSPQKPKKRVRFSDPSPEIIKSSSSTGLTPYVRRTILTPTSRSSLPSSTRLLAQSPRRLSLPIQMPSPSPITGELQFAPLRQVLDERVKRRLRRNNLSEELNEIDAERLEDGKRRQELQVLKNELAKMREHDVDMKDAAQCDNTSEKRVRELEGELQSLKDEMRERSTTCESISADNRHEDIARTDVNVADEESEDEFMMVNFDSDGTLLDEKTRPSLSATSSAAIQVAMPDPAHGALQQELTNLQATLAANTARFTTVRLSLERLFPGESTLPLQTSEPQPILDSILWHLHYLKHQLEATESALSAKQTQESNLRTQFNAVLQQLDRARTHAQEQDASKTKLSSDAKTEIRQFEIDLDEKERSIQKLQNALETYRNEVSSLEMLVNRLESEHADAVAAMTGDLERTVAGIKGEMDEAVADLECKVQAETKGRRAAEQAAVERGENVRELEELEKELRGSMNEKQRVIRELEKSIEKQSQMKEQEIGALNVSVGKLASSLADARAELLKLEAERVRLVGRVEEERECGVRAVERVKEEMKGCMEKVEEASEAHVKDVHSRGAEVVENKGLLTPVSAVRFRDAESCKGYVEIKRGNSRRKRRLDSGVGILEEEADEEEVDAVMV